MSTPMYLNYREQQFIIDDESYFTLSNANLSGNDIFCSNNRNMTVSYIKNYDKAKYEPKLLVWLAISPAGRSDFKIVPTNMPINQQNYLEDCLKKRLLPFIYIYQRGCKYLFWPDLVSSCYANSFISSCYANSVQNWLIEIKIPFIPKSKNVANVPEIRPIEDLWSNL